MIEGFEFAQWVKRSLNRRMMAKFVQAVGVLLVALAVCWLTWWAVYHISRFALLTVEPSVMVLQLVTWVAFVLLIVIYGFANREVVERQEFESPVKVRAEQAAAIFTDSPWLALTGPKSLATFVRVITAIATVGPGMLAASWGLLRQAGAARSSSPDRVGAVLATLAHAGTRVPMEELFRLDPSDRWETTFQAVRLFDGVIVRTSDPMGLALTERLRSEILKTAPPDVKRPQGAKPPPIRVSSRGQPGGAPILPKPQPGPGPGAPKQSGASAPSKASPPAAAPKPRPKPRPNPPE